MPMQEARVHEREEIENFISTLPELSLDQFNHEDSCAICLTPLISIFEEGSQLSSTSQEIGVTKLHGCGHIFCKRDLIEWIRSFHGNCPTCRQVFLTIAPYREEDFESSDGGEYIPEEDDDDYSSDFDGVPSSDLHWYVGDHHDSDPWHPEEGDSHWNDREEDLELCDDFCDEMDDIEVDWHPSEGVLDAEYSEDEVSMYDDIL